MIDKEKAAEETSGQFLHRVGIDGYKWAEEFIKLFGHDKEAIDFDLMLGWFCNAIIAGHDHGKAEADRWWAERWDKLSKHVGFALFIPADKADEIRAWKEELDARAKEVLE